MDSCVHSTGTRTHPNKAHADHLRDFCDRVIATGAAEETAWLTARYLLWREEKNHPAGEIQTTGEPDRPHTMESDRTFDSPQLEIAIPPGEGN
jgi:hypothetical protein